MRAAARQQPVQLVVAPSAQQTLPRPCVLVVVPVVVEIETQFRPAARIGAASVAAVAMAQAVVAGGEAGGAGSLEAGVEGGEAGVEVGLGEGEEGGLSALVGGFEGLGDLVEGLPDARVVAAHCVGCAAGEGEDDVGCCGELAKAYEISWQRWNGGRRSHCPKIHMCSLIVVLKSQWDCKWT